MRPEEQTTETKSSRVRVRHQAHQISFADFVEQVLQLQKSNTAPGIVSAFQQGRSTILLLFSPLFRHFRVLSQTRFQCEPEWTPNANGS